MNSLKDLKVLVIGLARSGKAAIEVLDKYGANISLSERNEPSNNDLDFLKKHNVTIYNQDMSVFELDFDLVVKNPGVSPTSDIVKRLKQRNIPIITEIELAYQLMKPQHIIAITGTNGKTTTTTLIYEILKQNYLDKALVGGNIGTPLCELAIKHDLFNNEGYYISLEISNHQLVDIDTFKPDVSTIINLTPDHLETMGSLDNYYKSKTEIYRNTNKNDLFILNVDDDNIKEYTNIYHIPSRIQTFSLTKTDTDCYILNNKIIYDNEEIIDIKDIKLVGKHNIQNVMISIMACKEAKVSTSNIKKAITNFKGVEHRIEFVREISGVKYYNDSKATNTDATITALKAFDKNVILLVGGYEKGLAMDELRKYLSPVKQIIGYGAAGKRICEDLKKEYILVENLKQAVDAAHKIAIAGDVVLLSPTTSSYDQYNNYEERGRHFKEIVNAYE